MKKFFIYCKPCVGVRTYIGMVFCEKVTTMAGITFFWFNGDIVLSLVSDYIEIEDRTEPET